MAKRDRTIIGLMSGMSMDGVDLACVHIRGDYPDLTVELLGTHARPFAPALRERLRPASARESGPVAGGAAPNPGRERVPSNERARDEHAPGSEEEAG